MRRGAFPGTFNPPTVAHLAVAEAARAVGAKRLVHVSAIGAPHLIDPSRLEASARRLRARVGALRLVLVTDTEMTGAYASMPVARVIERRADGHTRP